MEFIQLFVDYFCYYFTVYTSSAMLIVIVTKLLTKQKAINLSPFTLICHLEHSLKNKFLLKLVVKCTFQTLQLKGIFSFESHNSWMNVYTNIV